jgi:N utilization substance protein B
MERLDPVLRALLRAAAAELFDASGAPARAVINEYLDIAHGFFAGEEPRFANGVLDRLARLMRAQEFEQDRAGA